MNLLLLFAFLNNVIKKTIPPDCKECAFYSKGLDGGPGLCKKYGEKEDVTGKIIFYQAKKCRDDVFRCGDKGKYFIKK